MFRIAANPVTDAAGERVGTVLQWFDRTVEVATEDEVQSIVAKAVAGDLTSRVEERGEDGFFKVLSSGKTVLADLEPVFALLSPENAHHVAVAPLIRNG